jgi:hypothetical protein
MVRTGAGRTVAVPGRLEAIDTARQEHLRAREGSPANCCGFGKRPALSGGS